MPNVLDAIAAELQQIRADNLWKTERPIVTPQAGHIRVAMDGRRR